MAENPREGTVWRPVKRCAWVRPRDARPRGTRASDAEPHSAESRTKDLSLWERAGHETQRRGFFFHPAVNGERDRLTGGHTSRIQLASLTANAAWAEALTG